METIHTPDRVPDEPGVYRLLDGDEVAAIVTIPDLRCTFDFHGECDPCVLTTGHRGLHQCKHQELDGIDDAETEHAPRSAGRAFADTLGVPVVRRWRTNSARTNRRLARMADKGYSISRIVHIPSQRRATWSFVKVTR